MKRAASLLVILTALVKLPIIAQSTTDLKSKSDIPEGWMQAQDSKTAPALWECAGLGGSRIVSLEGAYVRITEPSENEAPRVSLPEFIKLSKEMAGSPSLLRTADGWLVGFDGGEFGGGLWWFNNDGDENRKLLSDNVHTILQTSHGVFVLVGLLHLSLDEGKIYQFTETAEEVRVTLFATLDGSPEASTVDPDGQIIVATEKTVESIDHSGKVSKLYASGEELTYPTSVVVGENGNIYVGMRFFVLMLARTGNASYRPEWLMSRKCQTFKVVERICSCTASN